MSRNSEHVDQTPLLPTELWERIFLNLPFTQLLMVRQTCHYWRKIVENCPALRTRFVLRLRRDISQGRQAPPPSLPVANAFFSCSMSKSMDSWWPPIAARITNLCFNACYVSLQVLQFTKNLTCLKLSNVDLSWQIDPAELKLPKLERLSLMRPSTSILEGIIQIKLQLRAIECSYVLYDDLAEVLLIIQLVEKVRNTLEELTFHQLELRSELFDGLSRLKNLELKRFSFTENWLLEQSWNSSFAIKFARVQPSIQDLILCISSEDQEQMYHLARSLPHLKRFQMVLKRKSSLEAALPFLGAMSSLEYLKIDSFGAHEFIHHVDVHNFPNLKELTLLGAKVKGDSLARFLQHSSKLRSISLENVQFDRWADLLASIASLISLQRLQLKSVYRADFSEDISSIKVQTNSSVRCLRLDNIKSKDRVLSLIGMFPRLRKFSVVDSYMCDWIQEVKDIVDINQNE